MSLIPEPGTSPGEGNGNSLQFSCLEDSMDRGACWATFHGVEKSQTQLSTQAHTDCYRFAIQFKTTVLFVFLKITLAVWGLLWFHIHFFFFWLGLHCCSWAFSNCGESRLLFIEVHRLWGTWASVVVAHRLSCLTAYGILPDQGLNPCPLHWQADSQPLDHQGSLSIHIFKSFVLVL